MSNLKRQTATVGKAAHLVAQLALMSICVPFGWLWGCLSTGFGAGVELAERAANQPRGD